MNRLLLNAILVTALVVCVVALFGYWGMWFVATRVALAAAGVSLAVCLLTTNLRVKRATFDRIFFFALGAGWGVLLALAILAVRFGAPWWMALLFVTSLAGVFAFTAFIVREQGRVRR